MSTTTPKDTSSELLDELDGLQEMMTKAPWAMTQNPAYGCKVWGENKMLFIKSGPLEHSAITKEDPTPRWWKDAAGIVALRNRLPEIIEAIKTAQRAKDRHELCATDGCELLIPGRHPSRTGPAK